MQTQRRHQIHMPQSSSTSLLLTGSCQRPSPTKSDIVLSGHCPDSDDNVTPASTFMLTEGSETDDYEERTRTWPRKRSGHDRHRRGVDDSNDRARLAGNPEELHKVSARLASQQDYETVFTAGPLMTDMQHYDDVDPSFSAATVAAELLGASPPIQSSIQYSYSHQYSVNSHPTPSSFSTTLQPFTVPSVPYPYSGSSVSPYSSPAVGMGMAATDGRHAVDMLFDHLSQSSEPSRPDTVTLRTLPTSPPQFPAHVPLAPTPFYLSHHDHHLSAADLSTMDHHANHAVSPATVAHAHHR